MQITNRRLRQINAALSALSGRTLPSITSDLKVAARLRELRGFVEDTDAVIRKIREAHPAPGGVEGNALPVALLERRQREVDELLDASVDLPDIADAKRITEKDLPKDDENRAGLADIVLNLDFLYAHQSEE